MALAAARDTEKRTVEVNRMRLIATLINNKAAHQKNYREAVEGYVERATEEFRKGYEKAKKELEKNLQKGLDSLKEFDPKNPKGTSDWLTLVPTIQVELKVPRDYSNEYDAAIAIAEWDVRETLELTVAEFSCWVRDMWDWSRDFELVNSMYLKSRG